MYYEGIKKKPLTSMVHFHRTKFFIVKKDRNVLHIKKKGSMRNPKRL